jgi:hypothetical protein
MPNTLMQCSATALLMTGEEAYRLLIEESEAILLGTRGSHPELVGVIQGGEELRAAPIASLAVFPEGPVSYRTKPVSPRKRGGVHARPLNCKILAPSRHGMYTAEGRRIPRKSSFTTMREGPMSLPRLLIDARRNFLFSMLLVTVGAQGAVTIEFVAPPPQVSTSEEIVLDVKATNGPLSSFHCRLTSLTPDRGDPAPKDSFTCGAPSEIAANSIQQVRLQYSSERHIKPGTYSANLLALALDSSSATVSQTVALRIVVPAVTLRIGETDVLRVRLIRMLPWATATEAGPVGFRVTSDLPPMQVPEAVQSELYIADGASKDIVPNGSLRAYFCDRATDQNLSQTTKSNSWLPWTKRRLAPGGCAEAGSNSNVKPAGGTSQGVLTGKLFEIEPSVPSNVKEASGVLRLHSPEFASDLELPITLLVKDWWPYAALAVFLGQLLSFWVNNWINTGRQRGLNKLAMAPVESGLVSLLLRRPDLEEDDRVMAIRTLLNNAVQANKLGEIEAARTSIKAAQDKLEELKRAPAPPAPVSPPSPTVLMLESGYAHVGRRLNFAVINPDSGWADNALYKWECSCQITPTLRSRFFGVLKTKDQGSEDEAARPQASTLFFETEGQNLKNIARDFWNEGQYILTLTVGGAERQAAAYTFRVDADKSRGSVKKIAASDKAILLLAVVFAAILSYVAIDSLQTFGSVSDYALAFLGGFGLNSTTAGFSSVLSRFRAGTSGTATNPT